MWSWLTIPLTVNGKVDRKALPAPDVGAYTQDQYVAPKDETERVLVDDLVGVIGIGGGGDQYDIELLCIRRAFNTCWTRMVSMIRDERGIELPLRVVFENPSVRELCACGRAASYS